MTTDAPEGLVTVREAARRLGRSEEQVRRYLREGRLEGRRLGGQWFIVEASLRVPERQGPGSAAAPIPAHEAADRGRGTPEVAAVPVEEPESRPEIRPVLVAVRRTREALLRRRGQRFDLDALLTELR